MSLYILFHTLKWEETYNENEANREREREREEERAERMMRKEGQWFDSQSKCFLSLSLFVSLSENS